MRLAVRVRRRPPASAAKGVIKGVLTARGRHVPRAADICEIWGLLAEIIDAMQTFEANRRIAWTPKIDQSCFLLSAQIVTKENSPPAQRHGDSRRRTRALGSWPAEAYIQAEINRCNGAC